MSSELKLLAVVGVLSPTTSMLPSLDSEVTINAGDHVRVLVGDPVGRWRQNSNDGYILLKG